VCVCVCVCESGVSYPACNEHASYYIVICGLSGSTIFFHFIREKLRFSEKKFTEHKNCALILSTYFVCNVSPSKKNLSKNYAGPHAQYSLFLFDFNKTLIFSHISNFMKIRPVAAEFRHADRRID
jgi:hypothetical protein